MKNLIFTLLIILSTFFASCDKPDSVLPDSITSNECYDSTKQLTGYSEWESKYYGSNNTHEIYTFKFTNDSLTIDYDVCDDGINTFTGTNKYKALFYSNNDSILIYDFISYLSPDLVVANGKYGIKIIDCTTINLYTATSENHSQYFVRDIKLKQ